jgi:hypothetical protein
MLRMSSHSEMARKTKARNAHSPGAACWLGVRSAAGLGLVKGKLPGVAPVLSVHDLSERGALDTSMLSNVRLPDAVAEAAGARPSLLRAGTRTAQRVITSSAADARTLTAETTDFRGQTVVIHGWVYGLHNGLLKDLAMTVSCLADVDEAYTAALAGIHARYATPAA